jgi:hypothetical protein
MGFIVTITVSLVVVLVLWLSLRHRGATTAPGEKAVDPGTNWNNTY